MAIPKSLFVTRQERRRRILALMRRRKSKDYPNGWTWWKLAKTMNKDMRVISNAFRYDDERANEPSIATFKAAARALNCTVGFLVDRKVVK